MRNQEIVLKENGLFIRFLIHESGIVELREFHPDSVTPLKEPAPGTTGRPGSNSIICEYPLVEVQVTGKSHVYRHGAKHNAGGYSTELHYQSHKITEGEGGKELTIDLAAPDGLSAVYHMKLFDGIPVVQAWCVLTNNGKEALPLEYVSSFMYRNLCGDGEQDYHKKTLIHTPFNAWDAEAHWKCDRAEDLNLSGMVVDAYNTGGYGRNRYAYASRSSDGAIEHLPMGFVEDTEVGETYCFQIEYSGQWLVEYGSDPGKRLYLALSGPTENEHGWWHNLNPGASFTTVCAGFGVAKGSVSEAAAALTEYRRAMRRPNDDDEKLNVVFNDYMNCLMGDPTTQKEKDMIDKAAEMGCEYYCMDCGWYDKGYWWDKVGEWIECRDRFPNGMKEVCDYAREKGMVMGVWLEIEVMGTACEMAEKLPDDWFIMRHGRRHVDHKRYLLDFRNPDVRKYCREVVDRLIEDYGIGYFKVDYNVNMGIGSELYSDSPAGAMLDHYRALYEWYEDIFRAHPDLVIENCGSGGMRTDYGMLRVLSLQSTSDQTDYIYNSYIAANVAASCTPEQAGMWVYPYEDEEEHVIYNMVGGILLRPYMSGMVWKLGENSMRLLAEGVQTYKDIRGTLRHSVPFFPYGFHRMRDTVLAYGLQDDAGAYLAVFTPHADEADVPLPRAAKSAEVVYPAKGNCDYELKGDSLHVKMPGKACARLFKLTW